MRLHVHRGVWVALLLAPALAGCVEEGDLGPDFGTPTERANDGAGIYERLPIQGRFVLDGVPTNWSRAPFATLKYNMQDVRGSATTRIAPPEGARVEFRLQPQEGIGSYEVAWSHVDPFAKTDPSADERSSAGRRDGMQSGASDPLLVPIPPLQAASCATLNASTAPRVPATTSFGVNATRFGYYHVPAEIFQDDRRVAYACFSFFPALLTFALEAEGQVFPSSSPLHENEVATFIVPIGMGVGLSGPLAGFVQLQARTEFLGSWDPTHGSHLGLGIQQQPSGGGLECGDVEFRPEGTMPQADRQCAVGALRGDEAILVGGVEGADYTNVAPVPYKLVASLAMNLQG